MLLKNVYSILIVLIIIYFVPFGVYSIFSAIIEVPILEGASPFEFLFSVLISKFGTSIAFVLIYYYSRNDLKGRWVLYGLFWWMMFVIGEIGQTILPNYSWKEATAGVISESIYCFMAAYFLENYIGAKS